MGTVGGYSLYTGRLRPKGISLGFTYMKESGNLSFGSVKGLKRLADEFYGFIK